MGTPVPPWRDRTWGPARPYEDRPPLDTDDARHWRALARRSNGLALFDHFGIDYKSTLTWLKEGKEAAPPRNGILLP